MAMTVTLGPAISRNSNEFRGGEAQKMSFIYVEDGSWGKTCLKTFLGDPEHTNG